MPVQTSPPSLPDSFPSFMSVFGGDPSISLEKEEQHIKIQHLSFPANINGNTLRRPLPFQHRESVSSATSGSADSSPTTTVSTFDSPITTDTSPNSSPESPTSMPLAYSKFMATRNFENPALTTAQSNLSKMTSESETTQKRPDSPGRRDRNLKNLSLRMPPPLSSSRPSISTASVVEINSQHHLSAPPSPISIPPKGMRRKPAGLTIRTPGFDRSFSSNISELVPPTPHGRMSLRHAESSPSLTSVFSPSFGPKGGMQLPRPSTQHGYRRPSAHSEDNLSPVPSVADEGAIAETVLHELVEEDDVPQSRESARRSERGYPNGPIQIYDSGVFLYLEPTADEASRFDVVVNVAKEVKNPFTTDNSQTVMSALRNGTVDPRRQSCSTPFTAFSDASFKSALEYLPAKSGTSTPKNEPSGPEYVHVGWDHNSEILQDLYPLCELIESRISQGKKVLIHCQLGASRSASLVIAYGLYKNPQLDFNSMYETVKERSRWVSPNMSLIYQLTDFRSRLLRGSRPSSGDWSLKGSAPPTPLPEGAMSSQTEVSRDSCATPDTEPNSSIGPSQGSLSSSSLSVPSTNHTTPVSASSLGFPKSLSKKRSVSPRPLALRQSFFNPETRNRSMQGGLSSDNAEHESRNAFAKNTEEPSLFSPRTTGFMAVARPRPLSGILEDGRPNVVSIADPRSPPQGHERLIMRSIDEFL
ncbi:putative protein-tyrosine phosphatase [Aspergillus mulundensis]|uniref:protein-tyrosine-phosphatase n=1 Tax=Aspergillus mulundensis TaxID=1810919 RepID=A0A3D8Q6S0_9EURO|nr:hypothetical protein DSM5745_11427 [Aspergillus mulundensis]RDW57532.1 hypothetical protein DSM5745_11427 [Aspergillus mulundensis]